MKPPRSENQADGDRRGTLPSGPPRAATPCDGNNDGLYNVDDILAANQDIFVPKSST